MQHNEMFTNCYRYDFSIHLYHTNPSMCPVDICLCYAECQYLKHFIAMFVIFLSCRRACCPLCSSHSRLSSTQLNLPTRGNMGNVTASFTMETSKLLLNRWFSLCSHGLLVNFYGFTLWKKALIVRLNVNTFII